MYIYNTPTCTIHVQSDIIKDELIVHVHVYVAHLGMS